MQQGPKNDWKPHTTLDAQPRLMATRPPIEEKQIKYGNAGDRFKSVGHHIILPDDESRRDRTASIRWSLKYFAGTGS